MCSIVKIHPKMDGLLQSWAVPVNTSSRLNSSATRWDNWTLPQSLLHLNDTLCPPWTPTISSHLQLPMCTFPKYWSTLLIWLENSWAHSYNHSRMGDLLLPLVCSTDIFMVNVPPACSTQFLELSCLSVKLGFLPVSTNILWLYLDVEQKAMPIAASLIFVSLGNSLPGACFPSFYDLSCFNRNLNSYLLESYIFDFFFL